MSSSSAAFPGEEGSAAEGSSSALTAAAVEGSSSAPPATAAQGSSSTPPALPSVELYTGAEGKLIAVLRRDGNSVEVLVQAAQVISWKNTSGDELLFYKAPRTGTEFGLGGITICCPRFCCDDTYTNGHGCRPLTDKWMNAPPPYEAPEGSLYLRLEPTSKEHKYVVTLNIWLGQNNELNLKTGVMNFNTSRGPFEFRIVHNVYLSVSDINDVRIEGLIGKHYADRLDNMERGTVQDTITFESEVDREFYGVNELCVLDHGNWNKRNYVLRKDRWRLPDAVIWNPWEKEEVWLSWKITTFNGLDPGEYKRFVCVGAAVLDEVVKLIPGKMWSGLMSLSVKPMSYPLA